MSTPHPVSITRDFKIGDGRLSFIAGPCQIESLDHARKIAAHLAAIRDKLGVGIIYKSSFDKANRTSLSGARGLGIDEGLRILKLIGQEFSMPLLTDVHTAEQCAKVAEHVEVLQIPAFLCRQTDLLIAAGETGRAINVKKGQFLAPDDMQFVAEKIASTGNRNILLCERGTCHGYRDLVVDMRALVLMARSGYPVVFDATHSVQQMGGSGGGASGGNREFIPALMRAAVATGVDAVFLECHDNPAAAPSDGASMLPLETVESLMSDMMAIDALRRSLSCST